jgi:hypothetical protein
MARPRGPRAEAAKHLFGAAAILDIDLVEPRLHLREIPRAWFGWAKSGDMRRP